MRKFISLCVTFFLVSAIAVSPAFAVRHGGWEDAKLNVHHVDVGGTLIGYAELGTHTGQPILLLNGTASPMCDWDPAFLDALTADGRRVIVFDYPGLGESGRISAGATFDDLADTAAGLLLALNITSADVLGWSMGGFVAQRMMVRHPMLLHKVVLAATNPGGDAAVLGPKWVQRIDSDPKYTLADYVKTNYPAGKHGAGWRFIHRVNTAQKWGWYPPSRVPSRTTNIMVKAEDPWLRSNANLRELASVQTPVLVITGRQDRVTPKKNSRILVDALPQAELRLWPRAGHSFLFQDPDGVAAQIGTFLIK